MMIINDEYENDNEPIKSSGKKDTIYYHIHYIFNRSCNSTEPAIKLILIPINTNKCLQQLKKRTPF